MAEKKPLILNGTTIMVGRDTINEKTIDFPVGFTAQNFQDQINAAALAGAVDRAGTFLFLNNVWGGQGDLQRPNGAMAAVQDYTVGFVGDFTPAAAYLFGAQAAAAGLWEWEALAGAGVLNLLSPNPDRSGGLFKMIGIPLDREKQIHQAYVDYGNKVFRPDPSTPTKTLLKLIGQDVANLPGVAAAAADRLVPNSYKYNSSDGHWYHVAPAPDLGQFSWEGQAPSGIEGALNNEVIIRELGEGGKALWKGLLDPQRAALQEFHKAVGTLPPAFIPALRHSDKEGMAKAMEDVLVKDNGTDWMQLALWQSKLLGMPLLEVQKGIWDRHKSQNVHFSHLAGTDYMKIAFPDYWTGLGAAQQRAILSLIGTDFSETALFPPLTSLTTATAEQAPDIFAKIIPGAKQNYDLLAQLEADLFGLPLETARSLLHVPNLPGLEEPGTKAAQKQVGAKAWGRLTAAQRRGLARLHGALNGLPQSVVKAVREGGARDIAVAADRPLGTKSADWELQAEIQADLRGIPLEEARRMVALRHPEAKFDGPGLAPWIQGSPDPWQRSAPGSSGSPANKAQGGAAPRSTEPHEAAQASDTSPSGGSSGGAPGARPANGEGASGSSSTTATGQRAAGAPAWANFLPRENEADWVPPPLPGPRRANGSAPPATPAEREHALHQQAKAMTPIVMRNMAAEIGGGSRGGPVADALYSQVLRRLERDLAQAPTSGPVIDGRSALFPAYVPRRGF